VNKPLKPAEHQCPQDTQRDRCALQCKHNYFEADDLQINSWELKCLDCGWRSTIAFRSDEEEEESQVDNPKQCPFCRRCDLNTGINPCESI
jgi:hypothetical protein